MRNHKPLNHKEAMMTIRNELTAQWEQRLQSWRDSGLNQKDWCDQHNVKQPQFWYWKKKLTTVPDSGSSLHESTDTPAFVAVALAPEGRSESFTP